MKTTKFFLSALIAFCLLIAPTFNNSTITSQELGDYPVFDWSSVDWDTVYNLDDVEITCSDKGYGRCYIFDFTIEKEHGDFMEFKPTFLCRATGDMNDNCQWILWIITRAADLWLPDFAE